MSIPTSAPVPVTGEFRRIVWIGLGGVLMLFVVARLFSAVWFDEICYTDPAVNLASGRGLISTVWEGQPANRFFACNTPLHPLLLAGAFKVFGVHRAVVQGMNLSLLLLASVLLWLASRRLGVLRTEWARLCFFLMVLLSSGSFYAAGFGRYDAVGMAVGAMTVLAASVERRGVCWLGLGLCGVVLPWAGLQMVAYGAVLAVFLLAMTRGKVLDDLVTWGIGVVAGMAALRALYAAQGVSDLFNSLAAGRSRIGHGFSSLANWNVHWAGGIIDPSLIVLWLAALVIGLVAARHSWRSRAAVGSLLGVIAVVWVSQAMTQIGRFPLYYSWMAIFPAAACVSAAAEAQRNPRVGRILLGVITLLVVAWLPIWIALASSMAPRRDLAAVDRLVQRVVQLGEVAVGDFASYYALLPRTKLVYSSAYVMTNVMSEGEKRAVTVVVVRPSFAPAVLHSLGGEWDRLPDHLGSPNDPPLPLNAWDYQLEVWRVRRSELPR